MLSQILRWLNKPKVLRLVCLASSVVGLLCYALSSSFNHLLGNYWSWWKMLLYVVFSFIICLAVLFAPARSSSTSLRLEAHLAFLVLIITSVYSFLFDNMVKGKPDAYSLISCAAFAIMSLGLSNLTQFGFQIDLLYFFCGGLTVQLMKIKLWLVIVGGGFSYSLLQLRDYPRDAQGENLQLQVQNQVIIQVDDSGRFSNSSHDMMSQQANDVDSTVDTPPQDEDLRFQDHILTQSNSPSQDGSVGYGLIIEQQLMNCIKDLEKENQMLVPMVCSYVEKYLKAVCDSKEVPDPDINLVMDALPSEIMRRLKKTLKVMMDVGFKEELSDVYSKWRRDFLEQCLRALGLQFERPNNEDFEKWLKTCKAAGKILFPNERRLCDYLFSGIHVAADVSFEKVFKELMIGLVSFVDTTITTGSYSPNLLSNIIPKMSKSLGELIREFTSQLFYHKLSFIPYLDDVQQRLAMVNSFRDIIYPDNVPAPVTDGGLHLITKEIMNYILGICTSTNELAGRSHRIRNSSFLVVIGRMMKLLVSELEAKSTDYYTDPALGYVFMINNLNYIAQKMHDLKFYDDWFREKVGENCILYLRRSWNKTLDFLKLETNESLEPDVVAKLMKDKLYLFNLHFEETCTIQSTWTISDKRLRKLIIKSIEAFLLPEYGKFSDRFRFVFGNQAYHYIKFGIVDIQSCLSHLFLLDEMTLKDAKSVLARI